MTGRLGHCGAGLGAVVNPANRAQQAVVEALDPDRQARHAGRGKTPVALGLEGPRIGFQRDLALRPQLEAAAQQGQQAVDRRRGKQAGRSAANEDRLDHPAPDQRRGQVAIPLERCEISFDESGKAGIVIGPLVRVEVAVGTFADAPWQMHVQRQGRTGLQSLPERKTGGLAAGQAFGPDSCCSSWRKAWPR